MELRKISIKQAAEAVNSKELSAHELIEEVLNNCSVLNEGLNIFTHIGGIDAIEQSKAVDRKIENGEKLPLAGIPVAVKDDICYGVLPTSFGSKAFREFFSPYTATAVERLMDAGAVVVGKTNLDNMGMGSATLYSPFGPTANPWNTKYTAGSAGAAAVATGVCMLALESDCGGALREGASNCGVIGLRPTMGRISRYGLNSHSSSFGLLGVAAISGENIISAMDIISGFDKRDASTAAFKEKPFAKESIPDNESLKIAYPAEAFDHLEPDMREVFEKTREIYSDQGFQFIDIDLPLLREALHAYYVIVLSESSSNHSRFDGIRFGTAEEADNLDELYLKSRAAVFDREARRRSIFGTFLLSKGSYDLYYRQALRIWKQVQREFANILTGCDLLMLPAVRTLPRLTVSEADFLDLWADDLFCAPISLSGLPALSLPAGQLNGIPVGLQLVGRPFSEEMLAVVADRVVQEVKLFPYGNL